VIQSLRQNFAQVIRGDFEIVEDKVRQSDHVAFWVVAVRPRRSGTFYFRHEYEQAEGYRHHDDESRIVVLNKGTPRRLRYDLNPQTICVGDTLLVPFAAGPNTSRHRFRRDSRFPQYFDGQFEAALDASQIATAVSGPLRYLGRELLYAVHRTPQSASLAFHAYFEAAEPGRCNLRLMARLPALLAQDRNAHSPEPTVVSVEAAAPEAAITTLLASVSTHAFDTPTAVSTGWASFPTTILTLRPGDRFSLTYGWMSVSNTPQIRAEASQVTPLITMGPHAVDPTQQRNAWLLAAPSTH